MGWLGATEKAKVTQDSQINFTAQVSTEKDAQEYQKGL
jgi:hypothetical protein